MDISGIAPKFKYFLDDHIALYNSESITGREWIDERKSTYKFYRSKFNSVNIENLSENEFSHFLTFRGNNSWTNLPRACKRLTNDMKSLRRNIIFLQDNTIPIDNRINAVTRNGSMYVLGFGKNLVTGLLHIFNWEEYGVWNDLSQSVLLLLECLPFISKNFGESYVRINSILKSIAEQLNTDLVHVDGFLWWLKYRSLI